MNRLLLVLCCMFTPFTIFSKWPFWLTRLASKRAVRWKHPRRLFSKPTTFVFAPGILNDSRAVIHFCKTFTTPHGHVLESKTGIELIDSTHCFSCDFSEVVVHNDPSSKPKQKIFSKGVIPRFFYHIGTGMRHWRQRKKFGIDPNSQPRPSLNLSNINIGQDRDQSILADLYEKSSKEHRRHNVVIYGFSRGAATTFNFMARKYYKQSQQKIKAVVLQGCFGKITHTMGKFKHAFLNRMLPNFSDANNQRQEPIDVVDDFPRSIPVLFITSERDELVPCKSTCALAQALKDSGHPNVYLLILKEAPHSRYTSHNEQDTHNVECIVHAFYKYCRVSYIPVLAKEGKELLEECKL